MDRSGAGVSRERGVVNNDGNARDQSLDEMDRARRPEASSRKRPRADVGDESGESDESGENDESDESGESGESGEDGDQQQEEGGDPVKVAKAFVHWCRQQHPQDVLSGVTAALGKICFHGERASSSCHHIRERCEVCQCESSPCNSCKARPGACCIDDCSECETGKWARYANELRLKARVCSVAEDVMRVVEDGLRGGWDEQRQEFRWVGDDREIWDWSVEKNCTCGSCMRAAPKFMTLYVYAEKLVRAKPWFSIEELALPPSEAGAPLTLPPLLRLVVKHWISFFSKLQEHALRYADKPYAIISRDSTDFPSIPEVLLDQRTGYMSRECHAACAALNELRRRASATVPNADWDVLVNALRDSIELVIKGTSEQSFETDYLLYNFEGTEEDNYCLGSRGPKMIDGDADDYPGAVKWYVGSTDHKSLRHAQHVGADPRTESRSSYYVRRMTSYAHDTPRLPDKVPDEFGGWRIESKGEEAWDVKRSQFTRLDEDHRFEYMSLAYGQRHVRGGTWSSWKLEQSARFSLEMKRRSSFDLCFQCGGSCFHSSRKCTSPDEVWKWWSGNPADAAYVQPANDDEALRTWLGLKVSYKELPEPDGVEELSHFGRACRVATALCNSRDALCQAVMLSSSIEDEEDNRDEVTEADTEWYRLVRAIWPPPPPMDETIADTSVAAQLRPAQKRALRAVVCPRRHNLALCLPTAYGKTRVFLTAAVHEVLRGRGKAVIFLPYKALMADITRTFEEISKNLLGFTVNTAVLAQPTHYDADSRVRGTATPYGGSMYVCDPQTQRLRRIMWTRWQGQAGDRNMRHHETTDDFKSADIVLVTPDKWMLPAKQGGTGGASACDSFLQAFGTRATEFGLAVVDEAHQFSGVLGGSMRELLRRMRLVCERKNSDLPFRVILASATIPNPDLFAQKLLPGQQCHLIQASEGRHRLQPELAAHASRMLCDAQTTNPNGRHRMLLFHRGILGITEVCNHFLTYEALGKHGVRRVLIFCDSKQLAARFVAQLRTERFKERGGWKAHNFDVFSTPYHGDCANMHRCVYERLFSGWVLAKQLHIIVATSALEAGVNICGPDVIIILDAAACSRDSLVQRIGRGGRVGGRPAIVIVGVDPTQLPHLLGEDVFDDGHNAIERYLFDDNNEPLEIAVTRSMVVHGALQHTRNLQKLASLHDSSRAMEPEAWTDPEAARADLATLFSEYSIDRCDNPEHAHGVFELRGACSAEGEVDLERLEEVLHQEGLRETPLFGRDQSARGMGMSSVILRKVTRDGRYERPYGPSSDDERPVRNAYVEVAVLDTLRSLRLAHPDAHYMTPHGAIYRVRGPVFESTIPRGGEWLHKLKAIKVYPISRQKCDEHYYCVTKSKWDSHLCFNQNENAIVTDLGDSVLERGGFTFTMEWKGFTYHSKFDNSQVGEVVAPEDCRLYVEGGPFFTPARWKVSGWQWRLHIDTNVLDDPNVRNLVRLELWLRFARALGCSVQQIEVLLLGVAEQYGDGEECDKMRGKDHSHTNVFTLQMAEGAITGLPTEALRRMHQVLQDLPRPVATLATEQCQECRVGAHDTEQARANLRVSQQMSGNVERGGMQDLLLDDRSWRMRLYDQAPPSDEIDCKSKVLEAIAHLSERWRAACGGGWRLPENLMNAKNAS